MKLTTNKIIYYLTIIFAFSLNIIYTVDYIIMLKRNVNVAFQTTGLIISGIIFFYLLSAFLLSFKKSYNVYNSLIMIMLLYTTMPFINGLDLLVNYCTGTNASLGGFIFIIGTVLSFILALIIILIKETKLKKILMMIFLLASSFVLCLNLHASSDIIVIIKAGLSIIFYFLNLTLFITRD